MLTRSLFAQVLLRTLLLVIVFFCVLGLDARAQQAAASSADSSLLGRFLNNFFNGSQDIAKSPWPYAGAPPARPRATTHRRELDALLQAERLRPA